MFAQFPLQIKSSVTSHYKNHYNYVCDNEDPHSYYGSYERNKFTCHIKIGHELSTKVITFHSALHRPTDIKCNSCVTPYIPMGIFNFTDLRTIDLSHSHVKYITGDEIRGNRLINLTLNNNEIEKLDRPKLFTNASKLIKINLRHNRIKELHEQVFLGIPDVEELLLSSNEISSLVSTVFGNMTKLKILELHNNRIPTIESNLFANNSMLTNLTLNNNNIRNIADAVFNGLDRLYYFDISHNPVVQDKIHAFPNAVITKLQNISLTHLMIGDRVNYLDASHNQLTVANLSVARNLTVLNLSHNKLKTIDLMRMEKIKFINLSANHLTKINFINDHSFTELILSDNKFTSIELTQMEKLNKLDLSMNQLIAIDFVNVSNLRELNLSHNNLENLNNLTMLSELTHLDLSFNPLKIIGFSALAHLVKLKVLLLKSVELKKIEFGTFTYQHNLHTLDISYNNLNTIDLNMFYSLDQLNSLYIDGNNLKNLDLNNVRDHFPILHSIGISDNAWNCTILTNTIRKLRENDIKLFVNKVVKHDTNVKGVSCVHQLEEEIRLELATEPKVTSPVLADKVASDLEEIKIKFNTKLNTIKMDVDKSLQYLNVSMDQTKIVSAETIHAAMKLQNERMNEKFEIISQKIVNLTQRLNELVTNVAQAAKHDEPQKDKSGFFEGLENNFDS